MRLVAGTRGSKLARAQTEYIASRLRLAVRGIEVETQVISTRGDRVLDKPLAEIGGKGLFTEELEKVLREGIVDFAVHSLKDLPTDESPGLVIGAIPVRANPLDAFVSPQTDSLRALRRGARIGTSSLRRKAQLRAINPTWEMVDIRGNVETRLRKIDDGIVDAVVLASAGLDRLDQSGAITETLSADLVLPACGQGALAVQIRADDTRLIDALRRIHDTDAESEVTAERSFLAALGGGCQVPIGALARIDGGRLWLRGCVCSLDGETVLRTEVEGKPAAARELGQRAADEVMRKGAEQLMAGIR